LSNNTFNINGTNYVISKGVISTRFALQENLKECYIECKIENEKLLKIDLFTCSSAPGTGRMLMYDLFFYLIHNNYITPQTKVTLIPGAYYFEVERITPNQTKLVKYYDKLGFDKRENIDENEVITLSGIVDPIMWNIKHYDDRTPIDPNEENQFYSTGGKRRKSKRKKSKRKMIKRKRTRKQL
jgi:hypothetical protein